MDAGQTTGIGLNFDTASDEAQGVLQEAAMVAEQKMKDKFPELPAGIPSISVKEEASSQTFGEGAST
jgi:hypothetical protein